MITKAKWRVAYGRLVFRTKGVSGLRVLAAITLLTVCGGAGYGIFLMHNLAGELNQLSTKVRQLDKLDKAADDIHTLTQRLSLIDDANKRIANMERYMAYIPKLSKTGDQALAQATATNQKLEITNQRLLNTDKCLTGTIDRLAGVSQGLLVMPNELRQVRGSIEKMATGFPALGEMRDLLAESNTSLDKTAQSIADVSGGLADMKTLLKGMNDQFAVLPEVKSSIDRTTATLTSAFVALEPLKQELPKLNASMMEMGQLTREMNQATKEMAKSTKKLPNQGALGTVILTAAQLLAH